MKAQHSSASNEHYTPRPIVAAAKRLMGGIDLDPFSCDQANEKVQASTFFCLSTKTNGLVVDGFVEQWAGRVLCNPPGGVFQDKEAGSPGASRQAHAWFKHVSEWLSGRAICGLHVCFSLEILQRSQMHESRLTPDGALPVPLDFAICYPAQRVRYDQMRGGKLVPGAQPPHASCLVFLPNVEQSVRHRTSSEHLDASVFGGFVREFSQFGRVVVPA